MNNLPFFIAKALHTVISAVEMGIQRVAEIFWGESTMKEFLIHS